MTIRAIEFALDGRPISVVEDLRWATDLRRTSRSYELYIGASEHSRRCANVGEQLTTARIVPATHSSAARSASSPAPLATVRASVMRFTVLRVRRSQF